MASNGEHADLTAQLHAIERGEAAPWTQFSPSPWWAQLWFAANVAGLVAVIRLPDGSAHFVLFMCLMASVAALSFLNSGRRGPRQSAMMPREFWRSTLLYVLGGVAVFALAYAMTQRFGTWPAAATAFVLAWVLAEVSERMYARAATRLRARLP